MRHVSSPAPKAPPASPISQVSATASPRSPNTNPSSALGRFNQRLADSIRAAQATIPDHCPGLHSRSHRRYRLRVPTPRQCYGDKVVNGESQLEIDEAGTMYDDSPATRGKGYDVEELNMIFEYGFGVRRLDEIRVRIMEANAARCEESWSLSSSLTRSRTSSNQTVQGQEKTARAWAMHRWVGWSGIRDSCPTWVEGGVREVVVCYCIYRQKCTSWVSKILA